MRANSEAVCELSASSLTLYQRPNVVSRLCVNTRGGLVKNNLYCFVEYVRVMTPAINCSPSDYCR